MLYMSDAPEKQYLKIKLFAIFSAISGNFIVKFYTLMCCSYTFIMPRSHHALMAVISLSVCPVPHPKSKTEGEKAKNGRRKPMTLVTRDSI